MEYFRDGCSDVNKNKKKSKFVKRIKLFALEKKKTYTSMMAPPGALFLSFSRFLRAFFSTGLESAYFPCVCRFASRFADGISKILSFFSLSFSLARRLSESDSFFLYFFFLFVFDFVQTGVAALRSGRNKGNVSYANDEEGFGGAALSNTTLASEDEEEEDEFDNDEEDEDDEDEDEDEEEEEDSESEGEEDEEEEEDSESEGEEDGDDEEEDSESENKRAKKKQRFAAPNGENNKKRKRAEIKKKEIESAVEKINDNKVLANAKKEAIENNFTEGSGAYVALVVLLAGKAVGIPSMNPATIEEFASQLSLEGKTKNGKKTKMDRSTIRMAMKRDETNFLRKRDRTYSLADKLEKKKETMTKKEKDKQKSEPRVVHVKRGEWGLMKFEDVLFYGNKNKWCPLCDGRTVVNRTFVMFYSHWILETMAEEVLIEHYGNEIKIKTERVKKALDYYFEEKLKTNPGSDIKSFDDVCRQSEELCHHCWTKLEKWLKQP